MILEKCRQFLGLQAQWWPFLLTFFGYRKKVRARPALGQIILKFSRLTMIKYLYMKLKVIKIVALVSLCLVYCSCDEIIDKNISGKKVTLYSPGNNVTITTNTVLFKWNPLDGAAKYRLQVVSPTFAASASVLADTIITATQFSLALSKGSYQWTVSAINNTATAYSDTLSLKVALSGDLSQSTVTNLFPKNAIASKNITFGWDKVFSAKKYIFALWSPNWQSGTLIKIDTVTTNAFTMSNLNEGNYEWGVKAINDSTETPFTHFPLIVDVTAPGKPTLISPTDASTTTTTSVTFQWSQVSDSGSPLSDSLYVASDNLFSNCLVKEKLSTSTFTETITTTGTYYWKVITCDAAGNRSTYDIHSFIRQ